MQSNEVQNCYKNTCLSRYGVDNSFKCIEPKIKWKQTLLKKYGVDHNSKIPQVKRKKQKTFLKKYGVDNWFKTDIGRRLSRENAIKFVEQQQLNGEPLCPRIGNDERKCLNDLQKYTDFEIQRNLKINGYFPDGFIKELNLVIEFDERHHFIDEWKTYSKKDLQKDKDYKQEGFTVFRISQKEWNNNPNQIINQFEEMINDKK